MRTAWTILLTVLCTVVLTVLAIGAGRIWFGMSISGQEIVQRSCGTDEWQEFCVQRTHIPEITLLRSERTAIEVHDRTGGGRYLTMQDPFVPVISEVTIGWGADGATLTDDTGRTLTLTAAFLRRLHD